MDEILEQSVRKYISEGLEARRDFPGVSRFNHGESRWLNSFASERNPKVRQLHLAIGNGVKFEHLLDVARDAHRSRESGLLIGYAFPDPDPKKSSAPFEKGVKDGQVYRIKAEGSRQVPEHVGGLAAVLIGLAWNGMNTSVPKEAAEVINHLSGATRMIGLASLAYGLYAMAKTNLFSNDARLSPKLETTGPFALHRNPFYASLGAITATTLIPLAVANAYSEDTHWPSLALLTAGMVVAANGLRKYVLNDERSLKKQFGQEYLEYTARTPRWIPRIFKTRKAKGSS